MSPDFNVLSSSVKKGGEVMSEYTERFQDRRTGKDRRGWDEFVLQNRRSGMERRNGLERRSQQLPFVGPEKRTSKIPRDFISSYAETHKIGSASFHIYDAAHITDIPAPDILDWIRWKWISDADCTKDTDGRFVFSKSGIDKLMKIKKHIRDKS